MKEETVVEAIREAERFILAAVRARKRLMKDDYAYLSGSAETAACRRASMDLTRALARMRKS